MGRPIRLVCIGASVVSELCDQAGRTRTHGPRRAQDLCGLGWAAAMQSLSRLRVTHVGRAGAGEHIRPLQGPSAL